MDTIEPTSPTGTTPGTPQRHLYLIDGSAYIFRAYHRLPPLTNPAGVPVGAVYGYTTMLWKLAEDLHKADGPTHLAVILDKGSEHRSATRLYDQYKANRPPPPEDLVPQFPSDSRCHARLQPCLHRGRGAGGRRSDRLLCPRSGLAAAGM